MHKGEKGREQRGSQQVKPVKAVECGSAECCLVDGQQHYQGKRPFQYVKDYVATPGFSEHHTGLAIDICLLIGDRIVNQRNDLFNNKEIFAKIHKSLANFGFILRYPEGKEKVTGYKYEPWHIRFVGKEVAKEIYHQGLTLEEYLEKVSK